jgi:hypothetical protein
MNLLTTGVKLRRVNSIHMHKSHICSTLRIAIQSEDSYDRLLDNVCFSGNMLDITAR